MTTVVLGVLISALSFLTNLFIALAINQDCKARNIKAKTAYSVLAFFFPLIVGIVYACTRKSAQKKDNLPVENSQKYAKKSIILFVVAVIAFVGATGLTVYTAVTSASDLMSDLSEDFELEDDFDFEDDSVYYDKLGVEYSSSEDVLYYAEDGSTYKYIIDTEEDAGFYVNQETEEKLAQDKCFIDEAGYFVYDENDKIQSDEDYIAYVDDEGNKYYDVYSVFWDENGTMTDFFGEPLN